MPPLGHIKHLFLVWLLVCCPRSIGVHLGHTLAIPPFFFYLHNNIVDIDFVMDAGDALQCTVYITNDKSEV